MTFSPKLNILPASQRALWAELKFTQKHFVLYGGTVFCRANESIAEAVSSHLNNFVIAYQNILRPTRQAGGCTGRLP
jgi:hypothetical protein